VEVPEDLSLPFELATPLFRVCQEALTNVTRHASASHVSIRLTCLDGEISLVVKDDGRGITDEEIKRHGSLGLLGMKERVAILGGTLDVEGRSGEGTTVAIRIPAGHKTPTPAR
jgi:signal transduction histidine kinase